MFYFCTVKCLNVAISGRFVFSGELAKLAVTFADADRFYSDLVICLLLDLAITLLVQNLVKI